MRSEPTSTEPPPRKSPRWPVILAMAALGAGLVWWVWLRPPDPAKIYVFPGVSGPPGRTRIAPPTLAKIADYERGSPHRLAILVTDETSGWLGLVRAFKAHGVPITVTRDFDRALTHRVVFVYPIVSGRSLAAPQIRALAAHVRGGGTVLTVNLAGGGLEELFGVSTGVESRARGTVTWAEPPAVPEEDHVRISQGGPNAMGTVGYRATTARVIATFDDGAVAAACRQVVGQACVLGIDVGALAGRTMNGRAEAMGRSYVNRYEPGLDVFVRWIRDLYVAGEPMPYLVGSAPAGKDVSIVLTHDIDFTRSIVNTKAYADMLEADKLKATFFIQTKYVRDYNDDIFFNAKTLPYVRQLVADGMDVGSHTVAHSAVLYTLKLGNGHEHYPRYQPFVQTRSKVRHATVLGELRVSKFLLTRLAGAEVVSFRPGALAYPFNLPEALQATDYRYSSSITANSTLTHLPYQLTYERQNGALTPIYEFPVTIEDEQAPTLDKRYGEASELVGKIARQNGLVVVLMHTNVTAEKLAFERRLVEEWRNRAWIGSLAQFGAWWVARDGAELDVVEQDGRPVLRAVAGAAVDGLAIRLPKAANPEVRLNLRAGQRKTVPLG